LTAKDAVKVKTQGGVIELRMQPDGRVTVNMGAPVFELARIPFDPAGLVLRQAQSVGIHTSAENRLQTLVSDTSASAADADVWPQWPLALGVSEREPQAPGQAPVQVAVVSMGNPHAVQIVADVDTAPVLETGALIEHHPAFPKRVNAGFMQIVSRSQIRLRVYERGAGETLACGTGACAAVVAGIRLGLLDSRVDVRTRGGQLTIEWSGALDAPVLMTGPATTVFDAEIEIPDSLCG
jgi:diaminopimelate epimerase